MLKLKRIDAYVLRNFLGLFFMTFFLVAFIIVMQFVWRNIDILVGKGLPMEVLLKLLFYAFLTFVPLALPLAILLASLMSFGNMGERSELTAMKTAGISLFRIMRTLMFFIILISVGAFFFSNNVIPFAQKKMVALLISIKNKQPELEIPVGEFYSDIKGMRIYVRDKNKKNGALEHVMVYDFSKGFDQASVTTADTAHISLTNDKKHLVLSLINGELFENIQNDQGFSGQNVPYRRETFKDKTVMIDFDANFNEMNANAFNNDQFSKNIQRLTHDIDSLTQRRDSIKQMFTRQMLDDKYFARTYVLNDSTQKLRHKIYNADSLFLELGHSKMVAVANKAKASASMTASDIQFNRVVIGNANDDYVRHDVEWHRKFTLSFACLIFFFIGAPLGAIIRKGGLGMPVVVSVSMFIIYYIIDTAGVKMAREGIWPVWQGMWLSSAVLLPIGVFLTWKAANDSTLFNTEAWIIRLQNKMKVFKKNR